MNTIIKRALSASLLFVSLQAFGASAQMVDALFDRFELASALKDRQAQSDEFFTERVTEFLHQSVAVMRNAAEKETDSERRATLLALAEKREAETRDLAAHLITRYRDAVQSTDVVAWLKCALQRELSEDEAARLLSDTKVPAKERVSILLASAERYLAELRFRTTSDANMVGVWSY